MGYSVVDMKKIAILLIAFVLLGGGYGLYLYNKKVPSLADTPADYTLTANELFDAFNADEQAALKKYEGKVIDLSGKVIRLNVNDSLSSVTLEATNSMFGGVNCSFSSSIASLKEGDEVRLKGRCQGFLMDVVLNNCYVIEE